MTMTPTDPEIREFAPWVAGRALDADRWTEVRDPYRGDLAARVADGQPEHVDAAVAAAREAQPAVAALPAYERAAALRRVADLIASRAPQLAEFITRETGKIIRDTTREAVRVPWTFRAAATAAETLESRVLPADAMPKGEGITALLVREPVGVVGAITPFNAPLNLTAHKIAPALAAGNAIVVKPAPAAPIPAFELAHLCEEAGFPPGAVNVVAGGAETATTLAAHPDVNVVTFTGGEGAGAAIQRAAGLRKVLLELGGNSPNIVHEDADLRGAIDACLRGGFGNAGQSCNSVQRVLVHDAVADEFLEGLVTAVGQLRVGDPLDNETEAGPVVSEAAAERVIERIEDAVSGGARLLIGGKRDGAIVHPTVVADAPQGCLLLAEEIFAPVVMVSQYSDLEQAFEIANGTRFGLQSAIFTSSLDVAMAASRRLHAGAVLVNRSTNFRLDHLPYGGVAASGIGREGPRSAVQEMTEEKLIILAQSRE